jgi:hypothetical protein
MGRPTYDESQPRPSSHPPVGPSGVSRPDPQQEVDADQSLLTLAVGRFRLDITRR